MATTDNNGFNPPCNWNPDEDAPAVDNHASSTCRCMKNERPGSFFSEANHIEDIRAPSFLRKNEAFRAFLPSSKSQKRRWRHKKQLIIQKQREQLLQLELQRLEEERVKFSSSWYPYDYYYNTGQQQLYPYVQPQFQQLWNSYLQQQQQWEQLSFLLETDNSFLTPWSWNPDTPPVVNLASSTSRRMKIEPGSFFSDNLVFSSEDQIGQYLSATYGKLDSSDKNSNDSADQNLIGTDVEQVSNVLLDHNLPKTNVGTEHEKSEDPSGINAKLVSDNLSVQKPIRTSMEQVSDEFNVDQIVDQYTLKMNRSRKFGPKAKWKKGASKVRQV